MERTPAILVLLVAAAGVAGCLGGDEAPEATVLYEFEVHPPDPSNDTRSDIDDFETLDVVFEFSQLYPTEGSRPLEQNLRKTFDWTEAVEDSPTTITSYTVEPGTFQKYSVTLGVAEALHENGSRPQVHTAPSGLYVLSYPEGGDHPGAGDGETLRFRWVFSVIHDDEEIEKRDVPEGDYFIPRFDTTGPVT